MNFRNLFLLIIFSLWGLFSVAQPRPASEIKSLIETLKKDPKGPYQQIIWCCPDGTIVAANQRCPEPGGVQRAKYKDDILKLNKTNHIFLGQILAATPVDEFLDAKNKYSRLKQYLLEKYLQSIDNGWVLRRGQYYRGAIQTEDENTWGIKFFNQILADNNLLTSDFFLFRESARSIPHQVETKNLQNIRSLSLLVAETNPEFMDIRIKIHGQPDKTDTERVKAFRKKFESKLSPESLTQTDQLIKEMESFYKPIQLSNLETLLTKIPSTSVLKKEVLMFTKSQANTKGLTRIEATSELLLSIREKIGNENANNRINFLDLSIRLEDILFNELTSWKPETVRDAIIINFQLAKAAAACGYIELWEWHAIKNQLVTQDTAKEITMIELGNYHDLARNVIEWGTAMNRAVFGQTIKLFGEFEPLAYRFTDDRIRSSILLPLGTTVSQLGNFMYANSKLSNQVMDIENQSRLRGLNPGFAKGELVVIDGNPDNIEVSKDKIYIFSKPPSDLKPVAGIATVSEGNLVSHVQLLARNLGIPNAVLSIQNLSDLKKYSGTQVFYAVSLKGKVIMKPEKDMSPEEKKLFEVKKRSEEKITIPSEKIELNQTKLVNLRNVNASRSGKLCGPKAANLGQLKQLFPEQVVEGLVVPFGIFRQHMNQTMPEKTVSYWQFLNEIFKDAAAKQKNGIAKTVVDEHVLSQLAILRQAIQKMPLLPGFIDDIKQQFVQVFGASLGNVPVFLRSDTNMEDLKDFTGAGLNLTLFNVLDSDKIIQGIKDVWASPYSERSYKWRQSYLLNPENVYPSILIIPGVNNDCSGVLITKGLQSGSSDELTVAFSRGVGGAVDGQIAETYILEKNGANKLLSPSRESEYTALSALGSTEKIRCNFDKPILSNINTEAIRNFAASLQKQFRTLPCVESDGPWDIELGFKNDKLWLFQVRPFVENKQANASDYLQNISKDAQTTSLPIQLNMKLK